MADKAPFERIDLAELEEIQQAERSSLHIRWWILPLAIALCSVQAVMNQFFEGRGSSSYLIATQISVFAFGFLMVLTLLVNPLLRVTRVVRPFNRAELMAVFTAMFVSGGISSFGLVDQLIPLIATPFNKQWNIPQRGWSSNVIPHLKQALFITDTNVIAQFRDGFGSRQGLWGKIPWLIWAKPIALWMIFVLAMYMMMYGLSMLLYDTWARREKLVFPLARLPEDLMHDDGAPPGSVSSTMRSGLFWIAFAGVFLLLSYNCACLAGWIPEMEPLRTGVDQRLLNKMLENTIFNGIRGYLRLNLIFTAVGIGFLLPLEISFSLWSYAMVYFMLFLVAIWGGAGATMRSFPSDWLWQSNFVSSLASGGLLAFASAYVFKLLYEQATARKLDRGVTWGAGVFLFSVLAATGWLWWAGVSIPWGLAFLAIIVLVTVALMRVVAEGGVYVFQLDFGPFHIAKLVGGVKAVSAAALAPLMAIYSILFLDIKTYIAPAILNSFKMQEETRASRRRFHAVVLISTLATVIVSTVAILYLSYEVGADRSSGWFFSSGPMNVLDQTQRLVSDSIGDMGGMNWLFYLLGAAWVVLSVLMRRRFFWWIHPIGFVLMINKRMGVLWFSFFIAWLCKRLAVKYGGRHVFARLRPLFIGLIMGQLAACLLWSILAKWLDLEHVRIDINY